MAHEDPHQDPSLDLDESIDALLNEIDESCAHAQDRAQRTAGHPTSGSAKPPPPTSTPETEPDAEPETGTESGPDAELKAEPISEPNTPGDAPGGETASSPATGGDEALSALDAVEDRAQSLIEDAIGDLLDDEGDGGASDAIVDEGEVPKVPVTTVPASETQAPTDIAAKAEPQVETEAKTEAGTERTPEVKGGAGARDPGETTPEPVGEPAQETGPEGAPEHDRADAPLAQDAGETSTEPDADELLAEIAEELTAGEPQAAAESEPGTGGDAAAPEINDDLTEAIEDAIADPAPGEPMSARANEPPNEPGVVAGVKTGGGDIADDSTDDLSDEATDEATDETSDETDAQVVDEAAGEAGPVGSDADPGTLGDLDTVLAGLDEDMLMGDFESPDGEVMGSSELDQSIDPAMLLDQLGLTSEGPARKTETVSATASKPEHATRPAPRPDAGTPAIASASQTQDEGDTISAVAAARARGARVPASQPVRPVTREGLHGSLMTDGEEAVESIWQTALRVGKTRGGQAWTLTRERGWPIAAMLLLKISKPVKNKPKVVRDSLGYIALWTLLLAGVLWFYVMFLRTTPASVPAQAPTRMLEPGESSSSPAQGEPAP